MERIQRGTIVLAFVVVFLVTLALLVTPVSGTPDVADNEPNATTDTVERLVLLNDSVTGKDPSQLRAHATETQADFLDTVADANDSRVVREFWVVNAVLIEIDASALPHEEVQSHPDVRAVTRNTEMTLRQTDTLRSSSVGITPNVMPTSTELSAVQTTTSGSTSSETEAPVTYGIEQIRGPDVWEWYGTGQTSTVAVLDTGVDPQHPDIDLHTMDPDDPTYPGGWVEFATDGTKISGAEPFDPNGHGTHTSGTVSGGTASGTHIGLAPDTRLLHAKVFNDDTEGTLAQAFAAMEWAIDNDADIIAMSLGGPSNDAWIDAIETLRENDITVVAASGNSGEGTSSSPGNLYSTIGVGAVDETETVDSFSSGEQIVTADRWGDSAPADWPTEYDVPTVTGPGVDVVSSLPDERWGTRSGTSMSTPHVAGTVALITAAAGERLDPTAVEAAITTTARHPDGTDTSDHRYGHGVVDAFAATMYTQHDGAITGTVTDQRGDPIQNATVGAGDVETQTDTEGEFLIVTDANNSVPVTVSQAGFKRHVTNVSVTRGAYQQHELELKHEFTVEVVSSPEPTVQAGDPITVDLAVSGIESVTISDDIDSTVDPDHLSVNIDGSSAKLGETVAYDQLVSDDFTVTVETDPGTVGTLDLVIDLTGNGSETSLSRTVTVQPTRPAVSFRDQRTDGTAVRVSAAHHTENVSVAVYESTDDGPGELLGTSDNRSAGTIHENIIVPTSLNETTDRLLVGLHADDELVRLNGDPVIATGELDLVDTHPAGVEYNVYYAVTDGKRTLRGGHLTLARGAALDGEPRNGVRISGRHLTLLRGHLIANQ